MPVNGQQKADQMVLRISCRASFGFFLTSDAQNDLSHSKVITFEHWSVLLYTIVYVRLQSNNSYLPSVSGQSLEIISLIRNFPL